jgi:hypothetical protein
MTVGIRPNDGGGPALVDQSWLLGLAGGANRNNVNGITAHSGGTKAAAFQLPANVALIEVETVAADNDSVLLPQAKAGTVVAVFNAGDHTLGIYGKGTDTINSVATATQYSLATTVAALFFCAKDGAWAAIKSA